MRARCVVRARTAAALKRARDRRAAAPMLAFSNARFGVRLPPGHRFPISKYRRLTERVAAELPAVRLSEAPAAGDDELALAHAPDYIDAVARGTLDAAAQREIGFPWSPEMVERSRRSVGATIAAARAALHDGHGVACHLAGGTHHARADRGAGFCVFNDVAVATRRLQADAHRRGEPALRAWVIDLDVHQGDGTAAILGDDPSVFTLSLHGERNFPVRKVAGSLDVGLPDGCGDAEYLAALDAALDESWRRQRARGAAPGVAFFLAGADPHEGDRLGRLKLTAAGLAERDRRTLDFVGARGVPVAVLMAGGYGRDPEDTVAIQLETVRLSLDAWRRWPQRRAAVRGAPDGCAAPTAPAAPAAPAVPAVPAAPGAR